MVESLAPRGCVGIPTADRPRARLRSMLAATWLAEAPATPICLRASREVEQRVS
jgi:hypothetical protein